MHRYGHAIFDRIVASPCDLGLVALAKSLMMLAISSDSPGTFRLLRSRVNDLPSWIGSRFRPSCLTTSGTMSVDTLVM